MSRRQRGEGSIYRRSDGRWAGATYVVHADGQRRRRTVYGRTRAEVRDKLAALVEQASRGRLPDHEVSVQAWLETWLDSVAAQRLKAKTLADYRAMVKRHIVPTLGEKKLAALEPADVREMIAERRSAGYSSNTARQAHAILRSALSTAVRDGRIPRNPASDLRVRREQSESGIKALSADEAKRLLDAARGTRLEALWVIALTMGLRKGELLGLQWRDIWDFGWAHMQIRRSLQRVGVELVLTTPKTSQSVRTLPLSSLAVAPLNDLYAKRGERGADRPPRPDDFVFCRSDGRPLEPRRLNIELDRLIKRADVPRIRFHDLRHTCATLMLSAGVPARVIMEQLGHSSITVTMNIYAHVMPGQHAEAVAAVDSLLTPDDV